MSPELLKIAYIYIVMSKSVEPKFCCYPPWKTAFPEWLGSRDSWSTVFL